MGRKSHYQFTFEFWRDGKAHFAYAIHYHIDKWYRMKEHFKKKLLNKTFKDGYRIHISDIVSTSAIPRRCIRFFCDKWDELECDEIHIRELVPDEFDKTSPRKIITAERKLENAKGDLLILEDQKEVLTKMLADLPNRIAILGEKIETEKQKYKQIQDEVERISKEFEETKLYTNPEFIGRKLERRPPWLIED